MAKNTRIFLVVLIILNSVVLLEQIWSEGIPPFARIVNIVFLSLTLVFFVYLIQKKKIDLSDLFRESKKYSRT
jgi:preprotein translocase subunit SecG